jgi:hypothetical protein
MITPLVNRTGFVRNVAFRAQGAEILKPLRQLARGWKYMSRGSRNMEDLSITVGY